MPSPLPLDLCDSVLLLLPLKRACTRDFQPFSSYGTHKLIAQFLWHTKRIYFLPIWQKNRYNFDSFTVDGYCGIGVVIFYLTVHEKRGQWPSVKKQVWHVLKIVGAHCSKISCLCYSVCLPSRNLLRQSPCLSLVLPSVDQKK